MDKVAVVYWSGTGNTEAMAKAMAVGMTDAGAEVDILEAGEANASALAPYVKLAFGCPSMGDEVLEESVFEPLFTAIEGELTEKKIALFGSYGWGDGKWMRDWKERVSAAGATVMGEGFIAQGAADEEECIVFGKEFAAY